MCNWDSNTILISPFSPVLVYLPIHKKCVKIVVLLIQVSKMSEGNFSRQYFKLLNQRWEMISEVGRNFPIWRLSLRNGQCFSIRVYIILLFYIYSRSNFRVFWAASGTSSQFLSCPLIWLSRVILTDWSFRSPFKLVIAHNGI